MTGHSKPHGPSHVHDLDLPAAGEDTGWWNEHGRPAPWPKDFWLADGTVNPAWRQAGSPVEEEAPEPVTTHDDQDF